MTETTAAEWPSLTDLRARLTGRELTADGLLSACLDRISDVDPLVRAVLALDPTARAQAAESDSRIAAGRARPLEGVPVLVKDNIDTAGLASTAGSRLLAGTPPSADADVVIRLRRAGAVVVGKTNLSEWGNFRSTGGVEGWSAVGGQTRNPHALDHSPGGSSSGSAVAVATGMVPLALGTETDGSIVVPAALNGVVGVKPALGLLPGRGIVPVSRVQDTAGVLAPSVVDAATCLAALTGGPAVRPIPARGLRIGLWHGRRMNDAVLTGVARVAERLRAAGVVVVPVELPWDAPPLIAGMDALLAEFRIGLDGYLAARGGPVTSLAELVEGNRKDAVELSLFGQDVLERAAEVTEEQLAGASAKRAQARWWARDAIAAVLADHALAGIVAPTSEPAWRLSPEGDPLTRNTSTIPAMAGMPNVTVPTGLLDHLPFGMSVFGPRDTFEALTLAAAVEAVCGDRRAPRLSEA
ncbi:amidase family protein [Saccharothrix texasensis]|uniref:Amidase n=1 Tax=Saccharothrix texasensis TaxID=103734 RepID=A0A3N1H0A0_9PSEU|nr:amidase family protein [Saccharothrix texasensis]ROP35961.1 amidase [Saccharothrix texasensis]